MDTTKMSKAELEKEAQRLRDNAGTPGALPLDPQYLEEIEKELKKRETDPEIRL